MVSSSRGSPRGEFRHSPGWLTLVAFGFVVLALAALAATERLERTLSLVLASAAFVAALVVGWFAWRRRSLAEETERRRGEAERRAGEEAALGREMQESERRFREIAENIREVFWISDPEYTRILYVSPAYEEVFGKTVQSLYEDPRSFLELVHPEDLERVKAALSGMVGGEYDIEYRILRPDGEIRWVHARGFPVFTETGELYHIVGIVEDTTDRKQAEAARAEILEREREARERVTAILESITDAFFALDREWRITHLNPLAREVVRAFIQREPGELLGQVFWDAVPEARGTRFEEEYRRAMETRAEAHFEEYFPPWDVWFEVHAYPSPEGLSVFFRDVTERRRREEMLRESEAILEEAQRSGHIGSWAWDLSTNAVTWSAELYRIFGLEPGTPVTYESYFDLVHPEGRERVRAATERALRERQPFEVESRIVQPDGAVRVVHSRGRVVLDETGQPVRMLGSAQDITERKERDEKQQLLSEASRVFASSLEYEETLRQVARLAVPHVADWCAAYVAEDGRLRTVEVAHRDPAKVELARELQRRYPPDPNAPTGAYTVLRTGEPDLFPEIPEELLERVAQDEEHLRILKALGFRSAMTVPLVARGRALGAITFVSSESGRRYDQEDLAFAEDLAVRAAFAVDNARLYEEAQEARGEAERRAREEEALRQAAGAVSASYTVEEVVHQIAQSALAATNADGAYVERVDIERNEIVVVAAAGEITPSVGSRHPFPGSLTQRVLERNEPELVGRLAEAAHPLPGDLDRTCPDCSAVAIPMVDAGEEIGALVLLRRPEKWIFRGDEVERASVFGNLASLAFRKVHILEESEKRSDELLEVMESRSRLMRGFSHDVKNPLGAADGFLQILEMGVKGGLSPDQEESVARARRSIGAALRLIDDLLDLARAEAGEIKTERVPVDVREAAEEMIGEYRASAEAKGSRMAAQFPEELPVIESDAARIHQILGNLLSNAVKYTPEGGYITVRVEVRSGGKAPGPGRWVAVDVSDTGPGIPKEKQHLLFQEFKRIEPGVERGAGLGLAISKRIAQALDGDITVESEVGKGSTFTLWLPLVQGERRVETAR